MYHIIFMCRKNRVCVLFALNLDPLSSRRRRDFRRRLDKGGDGQTTPRAPEHVHQTHDHREQVQRVRLVQTPEAHRHVVQQRGDTQPDLRQRDQNRSVEQRPGARRQPRVKPVRAPHVRHRRERGQRQDPVIELDRGGVLEEVPPPESLPQAPVLVRHEFPIHQREGVVRSTRVHARDVRAAQRGDTHERREGMRHHPRAPRRGHHGVAKIHSPTGVLRGVFSNRVMREPHVARGPQHGDVYGERAGEVRGEPVR